LARQPEVLGETEMKTFERARKGRQSGNAIIEYIVLLMPVILCIAVAIQEMTNGISSKLELVALTMSGDIGCTSDCGRGAGTQGPALNVDGGGTETTDIPGSHSSPDQPF
jgi:hypothetical protein